jgi:hypothetical protein
MRERKGERRRSKKEKENEISKTSGDAMPLNPPK